jgi:flagellar biosynthesis anti-sigma factor FlgM
VKIDKDKPLHPPARPASSSSNRTVKDRPAGSRTDPSGDKVKLARRDEINKLRERARAAPDVREDKVARVREAIKAGTYKVDSKSVARSILRDHLLDDLD